MIKEKVKNILGNHYSPKISEYLIEQNIVNSYGVPYSYASIQQIVNGTIENNEVLVAITELLRLKQKNQKKLLKTIEKI